METDSEGWEPPLFMGMAGWPSGEGIWGGQVRAPPLQLCDLQLLSRVSGPEDWVLFPKLMSADTDFLIPPGSTSIIPIFREETGIQSEWQSRG